MANKGKKKEKPKSWWTVTVPSKIRKNPNWLLVPVVLFMVLAGLTLIIAYNYSGTNLSYIGSVGLPLLLFAVLLLGLMFVSLAAWLIAVGVSIFKGKKGEKPADLLYTILSNVIVGVVAASLAVVVWPKIDTSTLDKLVGSSIVAIPFFVITVAFEMLSIAFAFYALSWLRRLLQAK